MSGPYNPQQDPNQQNPQGGFPQNQGYQQGPPDGYQQGPQGGYQHGGYQQGYPQGPQGGYLQGYPQGYQQGGFPPGGNPPPRRNGLILGIVAIVAVVVAAAVVLIVVLNKDDSTTANPGDDSNTSQQTAPVPPPDLGSTDQGKTEQTQQTDQTEPGGNSGDDEGVIRAQTEKFFEAIKSGDWDTVSSLVCEDARDTITEELQSELGGAGASLQYGVDSVQVHGDTATAHITIAVGGAKNTTAVELTKESGDWLLCSM